MNTLENTTNTTIEISASRLPLLRARLEELKIRCARRNVAVPVRIANVQPLPARTVRFDGSRRIEDTIDMVEVTIVGNVPTIVGWTFVGRLEHTDGGTIVHKYPVASAEGVDFEALRERGNICDHCETRRRRIDLFVLRMGETVITVGRNCLADYLRVDGADVAGALRSHDLWLEAGEWILRLSDAMPPRFGGRNRLPVLSFLACVSAVAKAHGYRAARSDSPTGDVALDWMRSPIPEAFAAQNDLTMPTENDAQIADAVVAYSQTLTGSGYEANLRAACGNDYVDPRNARLIASGFASYVRARSVEITAQAQGGNTSAHVGTVGGAFAANVTITATRTFDGNYGPTTLVSMVDSDGNVIKWFASGLRTDLEVGRAYHCAATVKKHDAYRGELQTMITRATLRAPHTTIERVPAARVADTDAIAAAIASPVCPF